MRRFSTPESWNCGGPPAVSVSVDTAACQSILTGMDIEELSVHLSSDDPALGCALRWPSTAWRRG